MTHSISSLFRGILQCCLKCVKATRAQTPVMVLYSLTVSSIASQREKNLSQRIRKQTRRAVWRSLEVTLQKGECDRPP